MPGVMLLPLTKANIVIKQLFLYLVMILLLLLASACELRTEAKLEGGNPPVFSIWSGTGKLWFASIGEYRADQSLKPSQRWHELWRIEPINSTSGRYPSEIGRITYGVVPEGYRQVRPGSGEPPPVVAGKYCTYSFKAENGMSADGDFEILDGNAVSIKIPGGCYEERNGKEIEVPCYDENANR